MLKGLTCLVFFQNYGLRMYLCIRRSTIWYFKTSLDQTPPAGFDMIQCFISHNPCKTEMNSSV